jgi:uncharacterized surface protein with fasciclin (FAS1) repeats
MKKTLKIRPNRLLPLLITLILFSCNDQKWDDYYSKPEYLKSGGIWETIKTIPNYREFASLLKKTGYDSILSQNKMLTLMVVPNGSFSTVDTSLNLSVLKKMIGQHILISALSKTDLNDARQASISGKYVRIKQINGSFTADGIKLNPVNIVTLNGIIHEINQVIIPKPNLLELIVNTPELSSYKAFIDSSVLKIPNPDLNIKLGYDSLNVPIYKEPIIYKSYSKYLSMIPLDLEQFATTVFVPTDNTVNSALAKLLEMRAGKADYLIPKLSKNHGDTIIGAYMVPKGLPYPGDASNVLNYIFSNCAYQGEIASLSGLNQFNNINGGKIFVTERQVKAKADASNGTCYSLNDISLPESVFRATFMFIPRVWVLDPVTKANTKVVNPYIVYQGTTATAPAEAGEATCYTGRKTAFDFKSVGGAVKFILPFVVKGKYKVILNYYTDDNGCFVDIKYGNDYIFRNFNSSSQYIINKQMTSFDLGLIEVATEGQVDFTFICSATSLKGAGRFQLHVDLLKLVPSD